jgi:tetratricopeptide (TPR) repeat protein
MRRLISWFATLLFCIAMIVGIWHFKHVWTLGEAGFFYVRGVMALDAQNPDDALKQFKTALNGSLLTEDTLAQIGYTYALQKDYQHALDYYWLAAEQNPKNYTVQLSIARILWALGWTQDALLNYEKLLKTTPENKVLMIEVGDAYYDIAHQGQSPSFRSVRKAYELYKEGLDGQAMKPLRPWIRYAEMAYQARNYDKAFSLYCQIVQQDNAPPEVIYSFALTLNELGRPKEAKQWIRVAAEEQAAINPELAQTWASQSLSIKPQNPERLSTESRLAELSDMQKSCLISLEKNHRFQGTEEKEQKQATDLEKGGDPP